MLLFMGRDPAVLVATLIALLLGMTIHEWAHNYIGYLMGDPVPAQQGRLTLDPRVHIDPMGWVMFLLIGFGVLGSAQIAAHRMNQPLLPIAQRWPRRYRYLAAVAAGPFSNLIFAIVAGIVYRILYAILHTDLDLYRRVFIGGEYIPGAGILLFYIVFWNALLFVFNLLPLFPIDGWHILYALVPAETAYQMDRIRPYTLQILFFMIFIGFIVPGLSPLGILVFDPASQLTNLILG